MDLFHILILLAAGVAGGMLSSVIGGASLVTFPALIAAGVPPLTAAICNLTATSPGVLVAALADRMQLPKFDRALAGLAVMSVLGAGAGASLLLVTPERTFATIVPLLVGFATVLFMFSDRISVALRERARRQGRTNAFTVGGLKILLPVSIYGGYFGAGVGILLLAVFSIATGGDYRSANVSKNLFGAFNNAAAAVVFIVHGGVWWLPTLLLMGGAVVGGLLGSWVARILPREVARVLVVAAGAALTAVFVWRYWL